MAADFEQQNQHLCHAGAEHAARIDIDHGGTLYQVINWLYHHHQCLTGSALSAKFDSRTKTLVGSAIVGTKKANVAGTGYTAPTTTLLAGNYFFRGSYLQRV